MLNLTEYAKKPKLLADYLPWGFLVGPGIILNKDGSFLRLAKYRGPDLESATEAELIGVTARINNVLKRFGSGWVLFLEARRSEASHYPMSNFPDPVSLLVDEERRKSFETEGGHFEGGYVLSFCWLPPAETRGAHQILAALNGEIILWRRQTVRLICCPTFCRRSGSYLMRRH
jgi:type IV secretion system protein TrbE